jgi:glycosyltransferase involved in cell wall biosynthesis
MTSIVIAAHNEGTVIGGLLSALTKDSSGEKLDIVVVCNGCSDDTADVARSFGSLVTVVETDVASKPNALNLGDEVACSFPRIYIDGDILVDRDTVMALSEAIQSGEVPAAGVAPEIDTSGCSAGVKAYYRVKDKLPSAREGIAGSGLYALSEAGRMRFGKFPDIVADDLFVRLLFKPIERKTVPGRHSVVFAAKNVNALMIQRTRSCFGSGQIAKLYPELLGNNVEHNNSALVAMAKNPAFWPQLAVYVYVTFRARLRARRMLKEAGYVWEREQTSRARRTRTNTELWRDRASAIRAKPPTG